MNTTKIKCDACGSNNIDVMSNLFYTGDGFNSDKAYVCTDCGNKVAYL